MTRLIFWLAAFQFALVALYHVWRYVLRRFLPSLCAAAGPVGWVLLMARELGMVPRDTIATPLICAGFVVSLLYLLIILHHEAQQPRPFR